MKGKQLSEINRALLFQLSEAKAEDANESTANRYMALIRAVLRRACEVWESIDRVPKVPMYTVRNKRVRWLTREDAARLLSHQPGHQAAMAQFALATGPTAAQRVSSEMGGGGLRALVRLGPP